MLKMPGARLVDGKVILRDGFNITDASFDEKKAYIDKSFGNMMASGASIMGRMGMGPGCIAKPKPPNANLIVAKPKSLNKELKPKSPNKELKPKSPNKELKPKEEKKVQAKPKLSPKAPKRVVASK